VGYKCCILTVIMHSTFNESKFMPSQPVHALGGGAFAIIIAPSPLNGAPKHSSASAKPRRISFARNGPLMEECPWRAGRTFRTCCCTYVTVQHVLASAVWVITVKLWDLGTPEYSRALLAPKASCPNTTRQPLLTPPANCACSITACVVEGRRVAKGARVIWMLV